MMCIWQIINSTMNYEDLAPQLIHPWIALCIVRYIQFYGPSCINLGNELICNFINILLLDPVVLPFNKSLIM